MIFFFKLLKFTMILFFLIFLMLPFSITFAQSERKEELYDFLKEKNKVVISDVCKEFRKLEEDMNKQLPTQVDEATELISFFVNCDTQTVKYSKRLIVDVNLFNKDWKTRKQRQHTLLHCNKMGLSNTVKWNVIDVFYDQNSKYLVTFNTSPKDCN